MPDPGDPGAFWRTYKGRYKLTKADSSSDTVMLTSNNSVQFTRNIKLTGYAGGDDIAVLDNQCTPSGTIVAPVCVENEDKSFEVVPLQVDADGILSCPKSGDYTLLLAGISFNIALNFYGGDVNVG